MAQYDRELACHETPIPGLTLWDLPVHGDNRGWFKETWQREKMTARGLPDFGPVQHNISFNGSVGTTRGIHAEPWDKWISVATGRIFGAWVDLREGPTFGTVFTAELDPSGAVFVPRGVGNAYQTLESGTAYSYLVNDHWSPTARYTFLNLADPAAAIGWPINLGEAEISDKDRSHPFLEDVTPMAPRKTLVIGGDGQLGRALRATYDRRTDIEFASRADIDITSPDLAGTRRWRDYRAIVNAAAFTAVDDAETSEGRKASWLVNVAGVSALARIAADNDLTLVHVSSDYVFDGSAGRPYREDDPVCPLGVYGQSKAAGDAVVSAVPRHYIVRTSWVVGDGANFVRTMASLADRGVSPRVVGDQLGRLTFADELARGIRHLLDSDAPFGTYNLTSTGPVVSWADIARRVFEEVGADPSRVTPVSTEEYFAASTSTVAPRPRFSVLDLGAIEATGLRPEDWRTGLERYLNG